MESLQHIVRETWLSQKPKESAFLTSGFLTLMLAVASFFYWRNVGGALHWMPATHQSVLNDQNLWQAWTALFAHADEKHLLSNSFMFFILSSFLGSYFGFLMFPVLAFFCGGVINLLVLQGMSPDVRLLGASGVVFWLGGAWLALYFFLDVKRTVLQRALRAMGVGLLLFFPAEAFDPQTSYQSHFIGFILGVVCGLVWYFIHRTKFENAVVREIVLE